MVDPRILPEIFYMEHTSSPYKLCYRNIDSFETPRNVFLVSRFRKNIKGKKVWCCLDIVNGNPEVYEARFLIWCFANVNQAQKQYRLHKATKSYAKLRRPVRCVIVDHILDS